MHRLSLPAKSYLSKIYCITYILLACGFLQELVIFIPITIYNQTKGIKIHDATHLSKLEHDY